MLWTLVLSSVIYSYDAGSGINVEHIPGFTTEQDCINAGNKILIPTPEKFQVAKAVYTCVSMGEKK